MSDVLRSHTSTPGESEQVMAPDKPGKSTLSFLLFLHENICCGYSLEAPRQGASNDNHNIHFCGEIRKVFVILG